MSLPGVVNYPSSADDAVSLIEVANFQSTTLDGDHNNSVTTLTVLSTTGFPSTGYVTIETECISYTGKTGTTFTGCTRGADSTTAASHADNTAVTLDINARRLGVLQDAIIATQTKVDTLGGAYSGCDIYSSGAVSIAGDNAWHAVAMDSERKDTGAYHDNSTNNSRATVPTGKGGTFVIVGNAEWANVGGGNYRKIALRVNGTTFIAVNSVLAAATNQDLCVVRTWDLADADYVELMAIQDSGGAINLNTGAYSPVLTLSRLG